LQGAPRQIGDFDWAINTPYGDSETAAVLFTAGPSDGKPLDDFVARGQR